MEPNPYESPKTYEAPSDDSNLQRKSVEAAGWFWMIFLAIYTVVVCGALASMLIGSGDY